MKGQWLAGRARDRKYARSSRSQAAWPAAKRGRWASLMRGPILVTLLLILPQSALSDDAQVLVVDAAHSATAQPEGVEAPKYSLNPSPFTLDVSSYEFDVPDQLIAKGPNSLQVIIANNQQYSVAIPGGAKHIIVSRETLRPNPGSDQFDGFESGQTLILAIGHLEGSAFSVFWLGMAEVK